MGLESVELVMAWEESFQITLLDEEVARIRTPRAVVDLICRKLGVEPGDTTPSCLTQHSFYRLRQAFVRIAGQPREAIKPGSCLSQIVPRQTRRLVWKQLASEIGVPTFPLHFAGPRLFTAGQTVGDLAQYLVAHHRRALLGPGCEWTRQAVRETVRAVISQQLGIPEFSDDADFVTDLRVG